MKKTTSQKFVRGAAILSLAGLLSKFLGSIYRIVLTRLLGAEGIGLFELAYPIYVTLLTISRSGIPVALAQMLARAEAEKDRERSLAIFKTARFYSIVIGLFFSVLMFFASKTIIGFLGWDPRVLPSFLAISPAIFIVSVMASYRGYFQGFQRMGPTGISQVLEQLVRMITMLVLVYILLPKGIMYSAAGATFGAVSGGFVGLMTMVYFFRKSGHAPRGLGIPSGVELKVLGKEIFQVAVPVTFGALVLPCMRLVDAAIIPARLQVAGLSVVGATGLYGTLATAMVLVNFPTIITVSLAASLVPSISEAYALKKQDLLTTRLETALRLATIVGLPASIGLFALAKPLSVLFFSLPEAAMPLEIVSWGVLFIALQQTSSGILQGAGLVKAPAKNLFWGALLNAVINYSLAANPSWGIKGAALGTALGFALAALLNLLTMMVKIKSRISFKVFLPIVLSAVTMFIFIKPINIILDTIFRVEAASYTGLGFVLAILGTVFLSACLFFLMLLVTGGIRAEDLRVVPHYGENLVRGLKKIKLIKE